ncbi:TRZ/ATZ family hydrolase [Methylophaga pinxianii]|uniref:TRZ/ATZ family hydrolase n=1 Tax=Methylophaga pinxianii TaxID=2881052 RepID=UPI001CF366BB|nr:TRZ/ATZ family hydrolase [Methylophaga pinxianii]MCB2426586.1 TRZ/ATZ family hydrolase [Methylophaga pinxianii]UPH45517.1 TRZ/ATZ family hydrolase [Methylophaga pinxianii]
MKNIDLIINARWCLPMTAEQLILENHSIVVHEGNIVALLPQAEAEQLYHPTQTQDLPEHCVMPGLINNHGHTAMTLFRGLADDLPLMSWLNEHIWPAEQQFVGDAFVEAGSALAIAEMIRGGTTCFSDMYFFPESTARVVDSSGIRASLGMVVIEFPTNWAKDVNEYLHKGQALHDKYRHHPRITTNYAPHAPYTVSDKTLQAIMINAEELDLPIQMHIHETAAEVNDSLTQYGKRPLARLKELGLLSPRLIAVHMTQLTEEEMDWCAEAGVHIAHCPESNLKLASGFSPIAALIDRGVNISIGTDGAASNNDLDMFAEMRQTAILAKGVAGDPSVVPAYQALEMATINAAKSLGIDSVTGTLEIGKAADIIAIDLSDIETQPFYDLPSQLVYATGRDKVSDVWVAGKQLLKQRQLTTMNGQHISAQAQEWATKIRSVS